jgi:negative regulator of flagellin synthesis FlgM
MHISNSQITKVLEVHLHRVYATQSKPKSASAGGPDQLVLSPKARDLQKVKDYLAATPVVREDVVNDLRSRVESGDYSTDSSEIADAIFGG